MREHEEQKPNQENSVVYYRAPQERLARYFDSHHRLSPKALRLQAARQILFSEARG